MIVLDIATGVWFCGRTRRENDPSLPHHPPPPPRRHRMSATTATTPLAVAADPRRIARRRAIIALVWAAAVAVAAGDSDTELSAGLALLVTAYPVIDVVASFAEAA